MTTKTEEVLDEGEADISTPEDTPKTETDDEEVLVEDIKDDDEKTTPAKMKTVVKEEWEHLNSQPPIWARCKPS